MKNSSQKPAAFLDFSALGQVLAQLRQIGIAPVVMTIGVIFSCCALAYSAHVKRQYVMELESLKQQQAELETEAKHYQLELSTLADPVRLEAVAKKKLKMTKQKTQESFVQL